MNLYAIAGAVLLGSIGANVLLFKQWQSARDSVTAQTIRAEQLDGQLSALHERIERAAEVRREGERHTLEVGNEAYKTDWGRTAVPSDLERLLCDTANCAGPDRVPTPDD